MPTARWTGTYRCTQAHTHAHARTQGEHLPYNVQIWSKPIHMYSSCVVGLAMQVNQKTGLEEMMGSMQIRQNQINELLSKNRQDRENENVLLYFFIYFTIYQNSVYECLFFPVIYSLSNGVQHVTMTPAA